jgi:hypothetical protein
MRPGEDRAPDPDRGRDRENDDLDDGDGKNGCRGTPA